MSLTENIPAAVKQLQLKRAFKGNVPDIMDCIETTTDAEFAIADDEECKHSAIIAADTEDRCCHIHNSKRSEIILLQIDNKLIANRPGGIADCAIFNTAQFRFIEFKTNAEGNSQKAVSDTYQKASEQLKTTLQMFADKERAIGIDFPNVIETECHIIVNRLFPRNRTSEQTLRLSFAADTGTPLSFDDEINF